MTAQDFKNNWTSTDEPLSPLTRSRLDHFNLQESTIEFLVTAGLPVFIEPNLSFVTDTDEFFYGVGKLTDQYDFEDDKEKYDKYVVIGSCRDGDVIAIDTDDNDNIVQLDHEDLFTAKYFNRSINLLAECLILYRDFEAAVLKDKDPNDNFGCFNFTDNQFEELKQKMISVDSDAMTKEGFWKDELEIMLSIRKDSYEC